MDKDRVRIFLKSACVGAGVFLYGATLAASPATGSSPRPTASAAVAAQTKTVTGTVTDGVEPIIGATVKVKGSANGAMTDLDGKFSLTNVPANAVLVVSYVGFTTQEIPVDGKSNIEILLKEDSKMLEEVVVVGFGTQKKVNLTGAVATVSADKFENRPVANIGQALQGVVPNLNIGISDGSPNTVPSFNVRGGTTISGGAVSNGAPLILVDGVDVTPSLLNQMNPNDIESMSVIKDASAAAIYGTKAAFGVILITTKNGKYEQKGHVTYSYDISWDQPAAMPDIMTSVG
ncbi:MAG: carboxypeptidase-like regulatory domain-containing protein, partial [Paramuribaculum sp.]|nr:carboxypeptidase-like regulatory domain-containing protein [Paramuribaculum sp.]